VAVGLGIDIGGSGTKAALVDLSSGELASRRVRLDTPKPSTPDEVAKTVRDVVKRINDDTRIAKDVPVGCGLPCVVKNGVITTAANIDRAWIGESADEVIGKALGRKVHSLNDADAAGIAEMRLGAGRDCDGTVLILTVGTGIGSAVFVDHRLVPNTELGHIELAGRDAETRISGVARERRKLRWKGWAAEFNEYLARLEAYLWPDLIILGGGVSKVMPKYRDHLKSRAAIVAAQHLNTAGIIGAAIYASEQPVGG
jgi:polyphosphate glucokinase